MLSNTLFGKSNGVIYSPCLSDDIKIKKDKKCAFGFL
jgi:hypothetical protein